MSIYRTFSAQAWDIVDEAAPDTAAHPSIQASLSATQALLIGWGAYQAADRYKVIEGGTLSLSSTAAARLIATALEGEWDSPGVTYNTMPSYHPYTRGISNTAAGRMSLSLGQPWSDGAGSMLGNMVVYGLLLFPLAACTIYTGSAASSNRPSLVLQLSEEEIVTLVPTGYPSSGYVVRSQDNELTWSNAPTGGACLENPVQADATVEWRAAGSQTVHTIAAGGSQSVTIPGGTFPAGTVEWRVSILDSAGGTAATEWYSLSTVETTSTAAPLRPVNQTVDGGVDNVFAWSHSIYTGTPPTASDLQISEDGSAWDTLATVTGAALQITIPGGTLSGGQQYWRVRTYNQDGQAGAWSDPATIVVIAAPAAPSVTATNEPRPTVTWTAAEQEAYEVRIDSVSTGPLYGSARSYRAETYLTDGAHTVSVRVQNAYGLWSDWGSWTVTVANTPGGAVALTATGGESPALSWTGSGYDGYWIYRDGALIAKVTGGAYQDVLAPAGVHSYQVRGVYDSSGNYGLSGRQTVEASFDAVILTDLETGEAVRCPYARRGQTAITQNLRAGVDFVHFSGAALPTAELSQERERGYRFRPSFPREAWATADALEGLLGKTVHIRDPFGSAFFAAIEAMTREATAHRRTYSVSATEIDAQEAEVSTAWS